MFIGSLPLSVFAHLIWLWKKYAHVSFSACGPVWLYFCGLSFLFWVRCPKQNWLSWLAPANIHLASVSGGGPPVQPQPGASTHCGLARLRQLAKSNPCAHPAPTSRRTEATLPPTWTPTNQGGGIYRAFFFILAAIKTWSDDINMCVLPLPTEQMLHWPSIVRWGTREALLRGNRRFVDGYAAAQAEPKLPLRGFCHSSKALPDDFGSLGPKQCHVIRGGEVYVGKAGELISVAELGSW